MPAFRITITDAESASEGLERHATYASARRSTIRSAVSILLERRSNAPAVAATCEIRNEYTGTVRRFDIDLLVGPDKP
ncbi:hypothetical protein [Sphingomonas sp. BK235]|uniref:hypothetical protein n=1 Tax=Sphingomonas sp. BK235 TaxID=2512131 RepID=UPI001047F3C2|nr:hypothetical protein [Sphingomonas sp. BK235]TCP37394.1 hypothetical protein EV292_101912 [Sphingomonas sp. BK235]